MTPDETLDELEFEQQIETLDITNLVKFAARQSWRVNKRFDLLPCMKGEDCETKISKILTIMARHPVMFGLVSTAVAATALLLGFEKIKGLMTP